MKFQSSSLATAIGMNRYEKISKEFERLWRATSSQTFTRAFEKASTKDTQTAIDTAIATIPSGLERVIQAKKMGERAMCTVTVSQNKTEILDKIDEDSKTLTKQKKNLDQAGVDTTEIQKKIEACEIVKAEVTKSVNTNYGTHREIDSVQLYEQQEGVTVIRDNKSCWKTREIASDISLIGRVDGLINNDCVLEVKNRTKKRNLFDSISPLENVQVQAYLFLFDRPRAILLQCFRDSGDTTLKPIAIAKDDVFWNETVVKRMQACARIISEVCTDENKALNYSSMTAEERERFLAHEITQTS